MRLAGTLAAAALALAACGARRSSPAPAWPKSAGWDIPEDWKEDGGESIDPVDDGVAQVETAEEPTAGAGTESTVEVTPEPPPADAPTPPPAETAPTEEPVPEETIIIEGELPPDPPPDGAPPSP